MKKIQFLFLGLFLMIASCTSTTKVEKQTQQGLRGDWVVDQIVSDEGKSIVITKLLGDSSLECFEGSTWHFVANNNSGYYTLNGAGCDTTPRQIKWFTQEDGASTYFWFKTIEDGIKAKDVTSGYKMKIISVDEYQAHLMHEVPFEGGKMNIHYYLNKQ